MKKPWLNSYDAGVPKSLNYPDWTVHRFLEAACAEYAERACTIYQDQVISYAAMNRFSDAFAVALQSLGVKKGDRIGVILPNIPQFVLVYYGILKAGGIVVAMNPLYKAGEIQHHLDVSGASIVVTGDLSVEVLDTIKMNNPEVVLIFTTLQDAAKLSAPDVVEFSSNTEIL